MLDKTQTKYVDVNTSSNYICAFIQFLFIKLLFLNFLKLIYS